MTTTIPGYRGPHTLPTTGSALRAAYDAAHARWCGTDCEATCTQWHPDVDELVAALGAYDAANATGGDARIPYRCTGGGRSDDDHAFAACDDGTWERTDNPEGENTDGTGEPPRCDATHTMIGSCRGEAVAAWRFQRDDGVRLAVCAADVGLFLSPLAATTITALPAWPGTREPR